MADGGRPGAGRASASPSGGGSEAPAASHLSLESSSGRRRGSVATLAASTYLSSVLGLVSGPIVARALGPTDRGAYAAVASYATLSVAFVAGGLPLAVTWALLTKRWPPGAVLGACVRASLLLAVPTLALSLLCGLVILADDGWIVRIGAMTFVAAAPISTYQLCLQALLTAAGALRPLAVARALPLVLPGLTVIVLAVIDELTLATYLAATFIAVIAALIYAIGAAGASATLPGVPLRPMMAFAMRSYFGTLAEIATLQLDQALVGPFLGLADLGRYAVAVTLANAPTGMVLAIGSRFVSQMSDDEGNLVKDAVVWRFRLTVLASLVGSGAVAAITPIAIPPLFGAQFHQSVGLCLVLLLSTPALAISEVIKSALILAGQPGTLSLVELLGIVVTVVGLAVSLPLLGVMGAAVTSVVAYWARAIVQIVVALRMGIALRPPGPADVMTVLRRAAGAAAARSGRAG